MRYIQRISRFSKRLDRYREEFADVTNEVTGLSGYAKSIEIPHSDYAMRDVIKSLFVRSDVAKNWILVCETGAKRKKIKLAANLAKIPVLPYYTVRARSISRYVCKNVLGMYDLLYAQMQATPSERQGTVMVFPHNIEARAMRVGVRPADLEYTVIAHEDIHYKQTVQLKSDDNRIELLKDIFLVHMIESRDFVEKGYKQFTRKNCKLFRESLADKAQAYMTVVEGHASYLGDKVGKAILTDFDKFRNSLNESRRGGLSTRYYGLRKKMEQYSKGQAFMKALDSADGLYLVHKPLTIPPLGMEEIETPKLYINRVASF